VITTAHANLEGNIRMAAAIDPGSIIAVVGSGAMGTGIAQVAAAAGHTVKLFDARPDAADIAVHYIRAMFDRLVEKGKMQADDATAASARLQAVSTLDGVAGAALVIEAITEQLEAKRALFAALEALVTPTCILASNTSAISITAIGAALQRPQRLVGLHFFNPVPLMALVEVVSGLATDCAVAETVFATTLAWGKRPVHAASTPGFIVNRVARPYYGEAMRVAQEQGADPATLDAVMRDAGGFRMGPFELMDLIGHDVNFAVTSSVFAAYFNDPRYTPSVMQQELVNAGYLGRKSGRGFFQYGEGAAAPTVATEPPRAAPAQVTLHGASRLFETIRARATRAGAHVTREAGADAHVGVARQAGDGDGEARIEVGEATIFLTDGRSATCRAYESAQPNTVLVDLALDFATAPRIALTRAAQCSDSAYHAAVGFFQACGYAVSPLADVPGMMVMRTVAMLINEAADAVNQGVCSAQAVDVAMEKGVNYPRGPLAWADTLGIALIHTVLHNLADTYGDGRYRISPLIQRKVFAGQTFHAEAS
jgi:3-hydroxybutyryl-CoA dehydrogenase